MPAKTEVFNKQQLKKNLPEIKPGDTVRLSLAIKEKNKEKIQAFEGVVIAIKHGRGISATITVRKIIDGIGVEKIFPIHSPIIKKIEILRRAKVRRAKLYYLRNVRGKKAKLKNKGLDKAIVWEEKKEEIKEENEKKEETKNEEKNTENKKENKEKESTSEENEIKEEKSEKESASSGAKIEKIDKKEDTQPSK